jgi:hypothetical protein
LAPHFLVEWPLVDIKGMFSFCKDKEVDSILFGPELKGSKASIVTIQGEIEEAKFC